MKIVLIVGKPDNIEEWMYNEEYFEEYESYIPWVHYFERMHYSEINLEDLSDNNHLIITQSIDVIKAFSRLSGDCKLLRIGRSALNSNRGSLIVTEYDLESVKMAVESEIELR